MKIYTCENAFKTTFFNNGNVERIEIVYCTIKIPKVAEGNP